MDDGMIDADEFIAGLEDASEQRLLVSAWLLCWAWSIGIVTSLDYGRIYGALFYKLGFNPTPENLNKATEKCLAEINNH